MTAEKPIEQQTVKALSWQLLYGNYRPKLGAEGWQKLTETVDVPDFRHMDSDEDCPMRPFNEAVEFIDRVVGQGDGMMIVDITRDSVAAWARMFKNLVKQLQGRPQKMMEIFCREVHPYFLNDPGASIMVESAPDHFVLRLDNGLLEEFKVGLIEGFCEIVGAKAKINKRNNEYHVTWEIATETPSPSKIALLVNAARLPFLTASLVPVLLGTAIAWKDGFFNFGLFLLTLVGASSFHLGTNIFNDYFDHDSGVDEANFTPTPFSGGSRVIQRGLLSPQAVFRLGLGAYVIGSLVGLYLVYLGGPVIFVLGLAGFLLGYLYTAPPVRLAHHGVGELAVAIGFGPLIVVGAYYVQSGRFSLEALLASLPVAFLIGAVLYINEFPDRLWDTHAGKLTLVARLPVQSAIKGYQLIILATYLAITLGVIFNVLPWPALLALVTIPMAWKAVNGLRKNHSHPYRLIPSNANTILAHLFTGLLLFAGYIVSGLL
jgi:1,4-dihydroxy-2-naphthoate octaprenyltransferase